MGYDAKHRIDCEGKGIASKLELDDCMEIGTVRKWIVEKINRRVQETTHLQQW